MARHMRELVETAEYFKSAEDLLPASQLFVAICRFSAFYSSVATCEDADVAKTLSTAVSIEEDLALWEAELPSNWLHTTLEDVPDKVYGGRHLVYTRPAAGSGRPPRPPSPGRGSSSAPACPT